MSLLRVFAKPSAFRTTFHARSSVVVTRPSQRWQMNLNKMTPRAAPYSSGGGLSKVEVEARILDVFKGFEKVNPTKLTTSARFKEDLGLDSLDSVEVVMAVEEEFSIEIPDAEADEITTVQQAINYILESPEAA
ncbi:Acyl carrier protein, mitochondrial [Serendipita sp. 411]|nr:Acyl carrier protein, mitochondrial [Serendipita sp. 397]KAG8804419.1 Acyl carrier protein, mitochondrial [Serendipita sp. 398]KAG8827730.1 Acyl carrier protein, mitochondrial [Serendipita sp. 401]KAG8839292.1 Acyl carrier protein, mitochondrial [Serendipita sp. 400]KAG8850947.1 Acyl carrier protein, mitochondrial [Serendipita sp. 411]KAG8878100.1 Acyl carrier protein, mitochondrial [Serendipita sp. 405]KAG9058179.1 Acyl carrier protein, mitochondrial [Serendipita sp. 407]